MSKLFRAVVLGEETGVFNVLKEFLFRMGLRNTTCLQDVSDICDIVEKNQMPIVFIDDAPGVNEGFLLYESMRRTCGLELVPFIFFLGSSDSVLRKFGAALGARGTLTKPFNPTEVTAIINPILAPQHLSTHQRALNTAKAILARDHEPAIRGLIGLEASALYEKSAGIALARSFLALSKHSMTEKKLTEIIRKDPNDLRSLCEIADLFMLSNKYSEAMRIFKKFEQIDPRLTVKVWDHLHLLVSLDDINGASQIIDRLIKNPGQRLSAVAALLRIMDFMGLASISPLLARHFPELAKKYPVAGHKEAS